MFKLSNYIKQISNIKQTYYILTRNSVTHSRSGDSRYDLFEQEFEQANFSKKLKLLKKAFLYDIIDYKKNLEAYEKKKIRFFSHGEKVKIIKFDDPTSINNWVVSMDSTWKEGFSTASFTYNPKGYATFSGNLDSETLPKTGYVERVGWANIMTREPPEFIRHNSMFQFHEFTHLVLKVRGDGRDYMINFGHSGIFDITYLDLYSYTLFTHGGPYWQNVKIPFSKFILTNSGKITDFQNNLDMIDIDSIGITLLDRYTGPFNLDIEYIGLENDVRNLENAVYETFKNLKI